MMSPNELPKSFDVEAETRPDPLADLSRSRAVRLGAAVLCGLGLAVSVFALIRAGQGLNEGRRAETEPQVVGSLAPTPAPLPVRPPAASLPAPAAAEAPVPSAAEAPAPRAEETPPAEAPQPVVVAEPVPAAPTTDLVAGASAPPAVPALAREPAPTRPVIGMPSGPMSPKSATIERDRPPPEIRPAPSAPVARRSAAAPPARDEAMRPAAVPGGSMPGVRAYTAVQDGGRVGPDGVRRIVVRVP